MTEQDKDSSKVVFQKSTVDLNKSSIILGLKHGEDIQTIIYNNIELIIFMQQLITYINPNYTFTILQSIRFLDNHSYNELSKMHDIHILACCVRINQSISDIVNGCTKYKTKNHSKNKKSRDDEMIDSDDDNDNNEKSNNKCVIKTEDILIILMNVARARPNCFEILELLNDRSLARVNDELLNVKLEEDLRKNSKKNLKKNEKLKK